MDEGKTIGFCIFEMIENLNPTAAREALKEAEERMHEMYATREKEAQAMANEVSQRWAEFKGDIPVKQQGY